MRSKRTQKSSSIGTGKSASNGGEAHDKATLLRGDDKFTANGDFVPLRDADGRPTHSVRLTQDIIEPKHSERASRIAPTIVLAGLGAFAALVALGVVELVLERVLSDAVALS